MLSKVFSCLSKILKCNMYQVSEFLLSFSSTLSVLAFSFDKTLLELLVPLYIRTGVNMGPLS